MKLLLILIFTVCIISTGCDSLRGPTGPEGPPGSEGSQGEKGATGEEGLQGDKGDHGEQGETGESVQGDKGETGDTGPEGSQGEKGQTGDTGAQGEQGDHGEQGEPGKDFDFTIIVGTLAPGEPEFWIFETGFYLERCIISVWVAFDYDSTAIWLVPTWIFVLDTISILNDEKADSGYRYRIIIASKPD